MNVHYSVDTVSAEVITVGASNRYQFDRLISLCEFLEDALAKEAGQRQIEAAQLRIQGNEEEQGFNSVAIDDNLFEIERDFPRIVRYSLLKTLMSTTEACLVRLCRVARKEYNIQEDVNNRGPGVIPKAIEYLQDKVHINSSRQKSEKELLTNLIYLRNAVTHADGCIDGRDDEQKIVEFAAKSSELIQIKDKTIILLDRFIAGHAHVLRTFVDGFHAKFRRKFLKRCDANGVIVPDRGR
ncbi:MAG: hypothetical protein NW701_10995 [Nitrospira sp.]